MAKKDRHSAELFPTYPTELKDLATHLSGYVYEGIAGTGKTGITYKLKDEVTKQLYCLKTIRPEITDPHERQRVRVSLEKECEILHPLRHRCLPQIYRQRFRGNLAFYVCTYHPGTTFQKFRENGSTLGQVESVFVIRSLMDALRCVHEKGRAHCDLHAGNVLISNAVLQDGVLIIDFGSGHRESDSSPLTPLRGNIYFKPQSQKPDQNLPVDRSSARFEAADFRGLGELLLEMQNVFFQGTNSLIRETYIDFGRDLFNGKIASWEIAERAFAGVVDPLRSVTNNTDLFLSAQGVPQEIPLPVIGSCPVGERSLAVINTGVFQRLRTIRQLSFCDLCFPGAVHTRFEHSLGVFAHAQRAINRLVYEKRFRETVFPLNTRGFLLAAMMHDVGHYPFAHPIEQYAQSRLHRHPECYEEVHHAANSLRLMREDEELRKVVAQTFGEEALQYALWILGTKGPRVGVLKTLLDGAIDIDKIDYLRRDAWHCGIPYGSGADIDGLFQSLTLVRDGRDIGITDQGVPAVEGLMILQDQMLASVYWHPLIRGAICMFHAALAHLVGDDPQLFRELAAKLMKAKSEVEAVEKVIEPACAKAAKRIARNRGQNDGRALAAHLIELVRFAKDSNFKALYHLAAEHPRTENVEEEEMNVVYNMLVQDQSHTGDSHRTAKGAVPVQWQQVKRLRLTYLEVFKEKGIEAQEMDVVIDVPYGKSSRNMVYVRVTSTGNEEEITAVSNLSNSIFTEPAAFTSPVRVYVSPSVRRQMRESDLRGIVQTVKTRFCGPGGEGIKQRTP